MTTLSPRPGAAADDDGPAEGVTADPGAGLPDGAAGLPASEAGDPAGHPGAADEIAALGSDWGGARRRRTTAGPTLGPRGWGRWIWRQLTSMRTALLLLFLLAVAAIPGSVLPQRGTNPLAVQDWIESHPGLAPTLDRLGFFDAFSSPWFSAIYLLLFISLIGCVLPRIGAHARAMRHPTPPAPRRLDRLAGFQTWTTQDPAVLTRAQQVLRSGRWRVTPGNSDGAGGSLAAEKGFSRETGNLLFHVALVLILIGVALGAMLGWKGTVIVREGTGFANTLTQYDSFTPGRLASSDSLPPFSFTMSDFDATFEREGSQRGAPRSFTAQLEYRSSPTAPVEAKSVSVNSPLRVDGAKVYLVGHGYAPHLRLTDSTGTVVFDDTVVFLPQDGNFTSTGVLKAPDASPQLAVQGIFTPTAALDAVMGPHSIFPALDDPALFASVFTGDLGLDDGVPSNVYTLDTTGLTQLGLQGLRPGDSIQLPDGQGTLEFVDVQRWASFTIASDPGKGLALAGGVAAIIGLSLSLLVKRRRIWVRLDPIPGAGEVPENGTVQDVPISYRVQVAGLSRTDSAEVVGEVERLVAQLRSPRTQEERT